ncbi:HHIP-like protein 1 [Bulinus truncatus]|nr:HHIP-like protein 1 [Bulinus truncatus]
MYVDYHSTCLYVDYHSTCLYVDYHSTCLYVDYHSTCLYVDYHSTCLYVDYHSTCLYVDYHSTCLYVDYHSTCLYVDYHSTCLYVDYHSTCLYVDYHSTCLNSFYGKVLRIDVTSGQQDFTEKESGVAKLYAIPKTNPFMNDPIARPELYALGVRNMWGCSQDSVHKKGTGRIFCAETGTNKFDEINLIQSGMNYGWNVRQGTACQMSNTAECRPLDYVLLRSRVLVVIKENQKDVAVGNDVHDDDGEEENYSLNFQT